MNTLGKISWLVSLLTASSVTACNPDDDADGGGGDSLGSGIDSDTPAEDLTDEDAKTICEAGIDYAEEQYNSNGFRELVCRYAGVRVAVERATSEDSMESLCNAGTDLCMDCLDDPEAEGCEDFPDLTVEGDATDCSDASVPEDCSSNAGELEACYKALLDQPMDALSGLPRCSEVNEDTEVPSLEFDEEMPERCETVEENCPSFFDE